ncbi:hypothetical protein [Achromobacter aegrifaciens]|uniref:hypothetical protein n=1 Tax=Achromobacter aegrifaciens TaxID=1287736 RepID=UPI00320ABF42
MSEVSIEALRRNLAAKIKQATQTPNPPPTRWQRLRQRFLTRDPKARGLRVLTVVTLLYLYIEFSFSAWLLDVMSENASNRVDTAEAWGRLISGFAVALLVWPVIFARTRRWRITVPLLIVVSLAIITAVYQGERKLIDSLVDSSTAESRAAAVTGALLRQGLATGTVSASMLDGLWADENAQSVAGKAFVGVVSYMAAQSDAARRQTMAIAPEVVRAVIEQNVGGRDAEYQRFVDSQEDIRGRHKYFYERGIQNHQKELARIPARAERDWEHYLDRLDAKNRKWGRARLRDRSGELVPGFVAPRVRDEVRKMGLDVPDSWRTGDKAYFVRLAQQKYRKQMDEALQRELEGMPPNLGLEAFAAHPVVQKKWRMSLGYPDKVARLTLAVISADEFNKRYYQPVLAGRTMDRLQDYRSQARDYGAGGKREAEGKKAYEAMIAPVFALTLSLLGALVHIGKTSLLLAQLASGWRFRSPLVKAGALLAAVLLVCLLARAAISTPLTSHPTYQAWTQAAGGQSVLTAVLDTMIKMQSLAYPVFDVARQGLEFVAGKASR